MVVLCWKRLLKWTKCFWKSVKMFEGSYLICCFILIHTVVYYNFQYDFTRFWFISQQKVQTLPKGIRLVFCVCASDGMGCRVWGNACVDSNNSPHLVNERLVECVIFLLQPLVLLRHGNVSLSPFLLKSLMAQHQNPLFFPASKRRFAAVIHVSCERLCVAYYQFQQNVRWGQIRWQIYEACDASFITFY